MKSRIAKISILFLLVLGLLDSCTCNYHAKRVKKKCGSTVIQDTLYIHDTTITESVQHDTIFRVFQKDTVIIKEGKLTVKYFYNNHDSTVYLKGKCDPDTIYKEIKAPYEKTIYEVDKWAEWKWPITLGLVSLLALLFLLLIKKKT